MRELEERYLQLYEQRVQLKKDIMRKEVLNDESSRNQMYQQIAYLSQQIEGLYEEKLAVTEKLFAVQENFIRKLDQQIDKSEQDPALMEKCKEDMADQDLMNNSDKPHQKKHKPMRGNTGQFASGKAAGDFLEF